MSEEQVPLQSDDTTENEQTNIDSNGSDDNGNDNIHIIITNDDINENDNSDDIQVIDAPTGTNIQDNTDDETQNLIHVNVNDNNADHIQSSPPTDTHEDDEVNNNMDILPLTDNTGTDNTDNDNSFVDVMVDMNSNPDNDSKHNEITTDNDSNQSNNNGYIVVEMDNDAKQNTTDDDIVNITTNTIDNITENKIDHNDDTITENNINNENDNIDNIPNDTIENKEDKDINILPDANNNHDELSHQFSVDSMSEPMVSNANAILKAQILITWVPKSTLASELTVIAGDIVTILHSEPIQLSDNPLALMNTASGDNFDKIITLNTMHWTQIQQRSGKIGVVPSNLLAYEQNPISNVWIKIRIKHSYMAKASNQLSITSNERLQMYGLLNEDGMIKAKRKDGSTGLIPWNFVEIPPAHNTNDALRLNNGQKPQLRVSVSSVSNNDYADGTRASVSRSRHSSMDKKRGHHHQNSSQIIFTIDQSMASISPGGNDNDDTSMNAHSSTMIPINYDSKKNKLTNKIKAIGSSISTAIDKIQYASYSHGANKTLEALPISSNLTSPSGKTKSYSTSDRVASEETTSGYEWSAPLQWKKVYVLKDFNASKHEIENIYQMFILDKQARGRNESILSYSTDIENNGTNIENKDEYDDPYNAAAPSKAKKTEKDVLKITSINMIEITGSPSPEGWVLARFCNDKERKGFVPISYLQLLDTQTKTTNDSNNISGIGTLLQQHQLNTQMTQETETMNNGLENQIVQPPLSSTQSSPSAMEDSNALNVNTKQVVQLSSVSPDSSGFEIVPRSKQPLPFHWPFSTYPIKKRSRNSKIIESVILFILFIIYVLPVLVEEPKPDNAPHKYNIWWINLFLVCIPWTGIFLLRMLELWSKIFRVDVNPNNKLYATLIFYIILIVYFFGLFAIVIEVSIQYEWIKHNSPVLLLATIVEILVFIACVSILVLAIIFILLWTFCCRISRNRWETRIEFYCCTRGEPVRTKRYPRVQK